MMPNPLALFLITFLFILSAERRYTVLGGQHTVCCLQELRKDQMQLEVRLPEWLQHVVAVVLAVGTPLSVRQQAAGEHQYRQRSVEPVRLSRWAVAFLGAKGKLEERVQMATTITGWQRHDNQVC